MSSPRPEETTVTSTTIPVQHSTSTYFIAVSYLPEVSQEVSGAVQSSEERRPHGRSIPKSERGGSKTIRQKRAIAIVHRPSVLLAGGLAVIAMVGCNPPGRRLLTMEGKKFNAPDKPRDFDRGRANLASVIHPALADRWSDEDRIRSSGICCLDRDCVSDRRQLGRRSGDLSQSR
jgi:hypothetical protein